jgi:hypothetical protein
MSRLEIIHLRTAGRASADLAVQVREAIGPEIDGPGVVAIYRRCGLDTDVAIHIKDRGETGGPSLLGLHLAEALGAFGLVEHSVWEELK